MRSLIYQPIFLTLVLLLGACTAGQSAVVNLGIEKVKVAKDTEAQVLKQGLCAMGVGAKNRNFNAAEKRHIEGLCGGDGEDPITLESLQRFMDTR